MKNKRQQLLSQLAEWDQLIRSGKAAVVRQQCRNFNHRNLSRDLCLQYADIARRVLAPELILLWLRPWVRNEKIAGPKPNDKEKAMYAAGLIRLGAFGEAEKLLDQVSSEIEPQVFSYQASLYMNQWNYIKAVPKLRKYIRQPVISAYSKLVGRLNLCASLVSSYRFEEAEEEIKALFEKLKNSSQNLLHGNLLEIEAQLLIEQKQYDKALANLNESYTLLNKADARSLLYVEKWRFITGLKIDGVSAQKFDQLQILKARAKEIGDWESLREFDFSWATAKQDDSLFLQVYWGSFFQQYRKRVLKIFNSDFKIEESFIWNPNKDLDTMDKIVPFELIAKAPTRTLKKLFFILTQDFYRPIRITEITDLIYPDEYYNPKSSPVKLHRLIARARRWLEVSGVPLKIQSYRNAFMLMSTGPCRIILHQELSLEKKISIPHQLKEQKLFTCEEWAKSNNVTTRTARRTLLRLIQLGRIQKLYFGPQTRYRAL